MTHFKLLSSVAFTSLGLFACSQSDGNAPINTGLGSNMAATNTMPTGVGVGGAMTTGTTANGTTTTGTGGTAAGTGVLAGGASGVTPITMGGATAAGGAATTGSAAAAACVTTASLAAGQSYETSQIDGSMGVYFYGDTVTTVCPTVTAGQVCVAGVAADAGTDYANFGAGIGVQMAEEVGTTVTPFDAASLMITAVRFTLSGMAMSDTPVRPQISLVNDGAFNFQDNGFVTPTGGIAADGTVTVEFATLALPAWATDLDGDGVDDVPAHTFDPSRIHSLQFQLETAQMMTRPFDLCVSAVEWLDAAGNVVNVPEPLSYTQASEGAGGAGTGGAMGMAGASMGGMNMGGMAMGGMNMGGMNLGGMAMGGMNMGGMGMGGASGGMDGAMAGVTFADIYPIFTANCSGMMCHGSMATNNHPEFAAADLATAEAAVTMDITDIIDRINRMPAQMGFMPRNAQMQLNQTDRDAIQAFADSL